MSFVTYVDVGTMLVRGTIKDGNNRQLLIIEASDHVDEKVVLVLSGSMASALKREMNAYVDDSFEDEDTEEPENASEESVG